jgi:HAD superfamily hydrolase (TIGR01490 family)|tara:strand:+ start:8253 stop:8909 length:657 start_codon:yes stop_codon:yes gene_type:complete
MNIALFDLDNTLISGDSDHEWGNFLVDNNYVDPISYKEKNNMFFEQYKNGTLCPREFAQFSYQPLTKFSYNDLKILRKRFFKEKIYPLILPKAIELVNYHINNNDILAIVTSTNSFISKISAEFFKISHLLASEPEFIDNKFTGRLEGYPCYQEGKVSKVKDWIKLNSFNNYKDIYFYTDSHNDIKLMEYCTKPIAVDPDDKLKKVANKNKWEIISLR